MSPYAIFCTVAFVILGIGGICGNLLIIGAILLEKQLKSMGNIFILNLAFVDLLVTAIVFPVLTVNRTAGNILPTYGCIMSGAIASAGCLVSVVTIATIAFERYIKVCQNATYSRIFTKGTILTVAILTWALIIVLLLPVFVLGERSFIYDHRTLICVMDLKELSVWYILLVTFLVFICILLCCLCYLKILLTVRRSKRKICGGNLNKTQMYSKKDVSIFKTMFTVFAAYLILCFPGSVVTAVVSCNINVPDELFQWGVYLVFCNSVVNGFIYGITNRQFRNGYKKCVSVLLCCKISVSNSE